MLVEPPINSSALFALIDVKRLILGTGQPRALKSQVRLPWMKSNLMTKISAHNHLSEFNSLSKID